MNYKKIFKKLASLFKENVMSLFLINLFLGYLTLLIVFIVVVVDRTHKNSDWFLENFAISESELKALQGSYTQLAAKQEF